MEVILYSTHCPRCNVIEQKLDAKKIKYMIISDINIIEEKGFKQVPMLEVDNEVMDFIKANAWVNNQ